MRWLLAMGLGLGFMGGGPAFADTHAPANDPSGFYEKTKALVDSVEPRGGVLFNLSQRGEIMPYTSARLISKEFSWGTVDGTAGYLLDKSIIAGAEVDLFEVIGKALRADLKVPYLSIHAGLNVGHSFERDEFFWGPSVNGSWSW